ncbi:hypothetical protein BJX63DRAFT_433045 [Aspergillus granulosus]|uniref:HD domain-containing protein n=1 Tax=Aspergillus granulosus TaxID=176169 RepID=A0ABR4H8T1_9EURO
MPLPTPQETISLLFSFITAQGNKSYLGERISQLSHSLQCAHLAHCDPHYHYDPEVILAALLHDVGRFIPDAESMPPMIAPDGAYIGRASHEVLGERYLRQLGFSEKVCQLVGAHVVAKRFLTATEEGYYEGLSETSKRTLVYQGGSFTQEQVSEARKDPWLECKLAVRRWDDQAKDPEREVPGLDAYEDVAVSCLIKSRSQVTVLFREYPLPRKAVLIISLPETLFVDSVRSGVLPRIQRDTDWIVEPFHHAKCSNRPHVEEKVLEQLEQRGIQVVKLSADNSGEHSRYLHKETCDSISRLPPVDVTSRSQIVLQSALSLLCEGKAMFAYLSLATGLRGPALSDLLECVKDRLDTLDAVVAVTAECSQEKDDTGRTVFDAVLALAAN